MNQIIRVPIEKLIAHPENPNRMSAANFKKLVYHIEQTKNYEPVIVRSHGEVDGAFEIINGHHRVKALQQIGEGFADCVLWDVDDDQVRILLSTLNRLGGKDVLAEKVALIKKLSQKYDSKDLAKLLPDTAATIERLKDIEKPIADFGKDSKAFLHSLFFFVDDEQLEIVNAAIDETVKVLVFGDGKISKSVRTAKALVEICKNK